MVLNIDHRLSKPVQSNKNCDSAVIIPDAFDEQDHLQSCIQLIRDILANDSDDFEDCIENISKFFYLIEEKNTFLILKEFISCESFNERLLNIQKQPVLCNLLSKVLTVNSAKNLLLCVQESDEMSLVLKNVLLCCRILQPLDQEKMHKKIGDLYVAAKESAKKLSQSFPSMESFLPCLLDFGVAPISHLKHISEHEHQTHFAATMCDLSPAIFASVVGYLDNMQSATTFLKKVHTSSRVDKIITWKTLAKKFLLKTMHLSGICFDRSYEGVRRLTKVDNFVYEEDFVGFFNVVIFAFRANRFNNIHTLFKPILDVFKQTSDKADKVKILLSVIFKNLPNFSWTQEMLPYVRLIQRNAPSGCGCQNLLFAAYKGLSGSQKLKQMYFPDILKGIKNCQLKWVKVLNEFLNNSDPTLPRSAYLPFHLPLRKLLKSKSEPHEPYLMMAFVKILVLAESDCSEDWDILSKYEPDFSFEENDFFGREFTEYLVMMKNILSDEAYILKLILASFNPAFSSSYSVAYFIRIFKKSKTPNNLALKIVDAVENDTYLLSDEIWGFFMFLVKTLQEPEIHERVFAFISYIETVTKFDCLDASALRIVQFIVKNSLCFSNLYLESCEKITEQLERHLDNEEIQPAELFYNSSALFSINPNYQPLKNPLSSISSAAYLMSQLHMNGSLNENQATQFVEDFRHIRDLLFDSSTQETSNLSLIIIELINEFQNEPYFDQLKGHVLVDLSILDLGRRCCVARCYLVEVLDCFNKGLEIPQIARNFLLDLDGRRPTEFRVNWSLQNENQAILEMTKQIFAKGVFDSRLVKFAASIYFFAIIAEENDDIFSMNMLTQLAR
jgi:hypothetical protein